MNSVRLPLPKACSSILAHGEERHAVFGLHVGCDRKEQTTLLSDLFTEERLRSMMQSRNNYADNAMFPFIVAPTDKSLASSKVILDPDECVVH